METAVTSNRKTSNNQDNNYFFEMPIATTTLLRNYV